MIEPVDAKSEHGDVCADHPMLAGHFPGHPIVPGAWLLAWVTAAAQRRLAAAGDDRTVIGVKRVKFVRPLLPQQAFDCAFRSGVDTLRFTLAVAGSADTIVAEGSLQLPARGG